MTADGSREAEGLQKSRVKVLNAAILLVWVSSKSIVLNSLVAVVLKAWNVFLKKQIFFYSEIYIWIKRAAFFPAMS